MIKSTLQITDIQTHHHRRREQSKQYLSCSITRCNYNQNTIDIVHCQLLMQWKWNGRRVVQQPRHWKLEKSQQTDSQQIGE